LENSRGAILKAMALTGLLTKSPVAPKIRMSKLKNFIKIFHLF
jgi:hypothetical protein